MAISDGRWRDLGRSIFHRQQRTPGLEQDRRRRCLSAAGLTSVLVAWHSRCAEVLYREQQCHSGQFHFIAAALPEDQRRRAGKWQRCVQLPGSGMEKVTGRFGQSHFSIGAEHHVTGPALHGFDRHAKRWSNHVDCGVLSNWTTTRQQHVGNNSFCSSK